MSWAMRANGARDRLRGQGRAPKPLASLASSVEVIGVDIKVPTTPTAVFHQVDLREEDSIAAAVGAIPTVHSVFSCAGLPGPPFSDVDTAMVNFVGAWLG